MTNKIKIQLAAMMFLQFVVWGAWYSTMGAYLGKIGFSGLNIGAAYSTINWGAIVSPFIVGMIADKYFSAQKVMGIIHIVGASLLWYVAAQADPSTFFWTLLVYGVIYMPTLALANTVSFNQMKEPEKEFPFIRVFGTIGWIVIGLLISYLNYDESAMQFRVAAGLSFILGIYCFFLPDTPPKSKGKKTSISQVFGLDALSMLKDSNFSIFLFCSFLISIPLAFYFSLTGLFLGDLGFENISSTMTLGQASEIIFMLLMPLFFTRLGIKKMLLIGMLAWMARYALFMFGNNGDMASMLYMGILLHGICYDFFFVTGQIYVDNAAPKEMQASAQGLITLVTYGFGMLIGSWSSGWFTDYYTNADNVHLWQSIWLVPAIMALVAALALMFFFKDVKLEKSGN
ncbi:MAG: nucleoside permease [Saprospiraceae bacterium]